MNQTSKPGGKQTSMRLPGLGQQLPLILQSEAAECGLACLAMVAGYYGYTTDIASLRRRFSVSLKGSNFKAISNAARAMHLGSRTVRLEMENLPRLTMPAILHWGMNHFVVLKSVVGDKVTIHDPGVGTRVLPLTVVSQYFTGMAMELTPEGEFEKKRDKLEFTLFGLMGRIVGLKRSVLQVILIGLVLELMAVCAPFYMQWVIDHALLSKDKDLLWVLGLGFMLLVLFRGAASAMRSWALTVLSTHLNFQWLSNVFSHMLKLPLDYFEKRHLGDIVSRFGSISTIQRTLSTAFAQVLVDGVLVIGTMSMMFWYSATLGGVALAAVLLYALLRFIVYRPLQEATTEQIIHGARQNTHFLETTRGMQSVRLFGRSDERRNGWLNLLVEQFNADLRSQKLTNFFQVSNQVLFGLERVIIIWLGALAVLDSVFSVGMLFAFLAYKDQFSTRVSGLVDKFYELHMMRLHGERVADIVLTEPEARQMSDEVDIEALDSTLEVCDLSFSYAQLEAPVLQDINLRIAPGECVAIAGTSGCGKTTLLKILPGLLTPGHGKVKVGGIDVSQLGLENFRKMIGTVMQDDQLFTGSIAENICFFDPAPDLMWMVECAMMAAIHDEINAMPMDYNSLVGDIGTGLSGGQKQRVLLARALYKKPKILILDEATSHLDLGNEKRVNEAIKALQITRIIVAHRPETIAMADRVIMMEKGKILRDWNVKSNEPLDLKEHVAQVEK